MKKRHALWRRMDNMAHIFTPAASRQDPLVIRASFALTETVEPEYLQKALDRTLAFVPYFRSVVRKGLFWYYLEESTLRPLVHEENRPPCSPLYNRGVPGLLFDVSYFGNRISIEVFHSLCDGAGAILFLKAVSLYYFFERYGGDEPDLAFFPSGTDAGQDNINKHFQKNNIHTLTRRNRAFHQRSEQLSEYRLSVVEGCMPVVQILSLAKQAQATLTEYLTALLIDSIGRTMTQRDKRRPVVVTIPADMRQYFPMDKSSRNFFSIMNISHRFQEGDTFADVLASAKQQFSEKSNRESLLDRMNRMASIEHNIAIRAIPLLIKAPMLRLFHYQAKRGVTASFSNVGRVSFPPHVQPYIQDVSCMSSTKEMHVCSSSSGDVLSITFASHFRSLNVQRYFFQALARQGVPITISETNGEEVDA